MNDGLILLLIILLLILGGGGWYSYRPGGWGSGPGSFLWILAVIILAVIVAKLLGVA